MKKECLKAIEMMNLLIDNKLDDASLEWFKKHLSSCNNCAKELSNLQKIKMVLKNVRQEKLPSDFYFRLNEALDVIDEKQKSNGFFQNFQLAFRTGLIFAVVILGFVVTLKVVKNNQHFISPNLQEKEQKIILSESEKTEYAMKKTIKKEKVQIDTKVKLDDAVMKETLVIPAPAAAEIEYKKPGVPFKLVSTGEPYYQTQKKSSRVYIQPVPVKSYYELNQEQVRDKFDLKVFNFIVDDKYTWEKLKNEYNINEFPEVNFQTDTLVLITCKEEITDNYSIEIINAIKEIDKIVVLYRLSKYSGEHFKDIKGRLKNYDIKIISKTQLPVIFKRIE